MSKFVAFLRGINVGGNKRVPMNELKTCFEDLGFYNVKTILASGNVIFEGDSKQTDKIEQAIETKFGFQVDIIIIPFDKITEIIDSDPFKKIVITPKIRLYVSFYKEIKESTLKIPYISNDKSFQIIKITDIAIISVLDLEKTGTIDGMKILEKEYGKKLTTRNFNTIFKIKNK